MSDAIHNKTRQGLEMILKWTVRSILVCILAVSVTSEARAQLDPCEIVAAGNWMVIARNGDVWDFTNAPGGNVSPAFNVFGVATPGKYIVGLEQWLSGPFAVCDNFGDFYVLNGQASPQNVFDRAGLSRGQLTHYSAAYGIGMLVTSTGAVYRNSNLSASAWVLQGALAGGFTPTSQRSWGSLKIMHR